MAGCSPLLPTFLVLRQPWPPRLPLSLTSSHLSPTGRAPFTPSKKPRPPPHSDAGQPRELAYSQRYLRLPRLAPATSRIASSRIAGKIMIGSGSWVTYGDYEGRPNLIWTLETFAQETNRSRVGFLRTMTNFWTYEAIQPIFLPTTIFKPSRPQAVLLVEIIKHVHMHEILCKT
jgi:hypothetical protein